MGNFLEVRALHLLNEIVENKCIEEHSLLSEPFWYWFSTPYKSQKGKWFSSINKLDIWQIKSHAT
jgi:hypothetical protein